MADVNDRVVPAVEQLTSRNNDAVVPAPYKYNFKLLDLARTSFGYQRLYLPYLKRMPKGDKAKYENLKVLDQKFEQRSSYMNTPIVAPLKVQISKKGEPLEYYQFPNEPIITIRGTKKIVETDIDGQDGTFKQIYNLGDYLITIQGVAVSEDYTNEDYPEEIARKLRTVYELRHHLEVVGPLFTLFNIKYISLYDFEHNQEAGGWSQIQYQFQAKSDKEYKLTLKKKTTV